MYNGIGLQTPRGSGTNGYIQSNKFHVRARPGKVEAREYGADEGTGGVSRKANKEILEHDRMRQIEVRLVELEEELVEKGFTDEEIQTQLAQARKELEQESKGDVLKSEKVSETQTHQIAALKEQKLDELKKALKSSNPEPGAAFDRELQKKLKEMRKAASEARKKEREEEREERERVEEEQRRKKRKESSAKKESSGSERRSRDDHSEKKSRDDHSEKKSRDDHSERRSRGDHSSDRKPPTPRDDHSSDRRSSRDDHSERRSSRDDYSERRSSRDDHSERRSRDDHSERRSSRDDHQEIKKERGD